MGFAADLKALCDKAGDKAEMVVRGAALELGGQMIDRSPVDTGRFKNNWELSAARAVAVVRYLADKGIPPEHLAAAGFGEFQPLEDGDSDEQLAKNRRIELKLTER